jgi:hypothetical protein
MHLFKKKTTKKKYVDCDGTLFFRADCLQRGACVNQANHGATDLEHMVTAVVKTPHVHYDLIVESRVTGNLNGQFSFRYSTTATVGGSTTSTTWTTSRLLDVTQNKKADSVAIDCQFTQPALVEMESVGQQLRKLDDPAPQWVSINTRPFPVKVQIT